MPVKMMSVLKRMRQWARTIKRDVHAIGLAARDPRVPWYAKAMRRGGRRLCAQSD